MTLIRPRLEQAACRGREDLYLQPRPGPTKLKTMRAICAGCWDKPECLAHALECEEQLVWAGTTPAERRTLRSEYGIKLEPILVGAWVGTLYNPKEDEDHGEDQAADGE